MPVRLPSGKRVGLVQPSPTNVCLAVASPCSAHPGSLQLTLGGSELEQHLHSGTGNMDKARKQSVFLKIIRASCNKIFHFWVFPSFFSSLVTISIIQCLNNKIQSSSIMIQPPKNVLWLCLCLLWKEKSHPKWSRETIKHKILVGFGSCLYHIIIHHILTILTSIHLNGTNLEDFDLFCFHT